jgi:HK97 family phage prohead protease
VWSATSVGFNPIKFAFTDDPQRCYGIDFLEQELLEFSCVPVPANADALIEARNAGVDVDQLLAWARGILG